MKTLRTFSKLITVVAVFAMVLSFASCGLFGGGSLKLESFTVDRASVKTNYLVGEEIDFSGIRATAKYSDETLNKVYVFDELTITYPDDITATVGEKEVTVSFDDPHLNVKQETKVKIQVSAEPDVNDTPDPQIVVQFEKPQSLVNFDTANADAGKANYGDADFSGQYAAGNKLYIIGNENGFKLNPSFSVLDESASVVELKSFYSVVEISVEKDGAYVALSKTEGENNLVSYYDGETLIVTVDTYNGIYTFSESSEALKVKISVLPSEEKYIMDGINAIVLEARIVKAYNIYEAWELAVIDNASAHDHGISSDDNYIWEVFKTEKGIKDVNPSGVVIHADLTVTAAEIPTQFLLTTTKDTVYTNTITGSKETVPAGTHYLKDWSEIYRRELAANESFIIEGNFFTIDLTQFPIVPSPAVFGSEGDSDDYGSDFSNATFFKFVNEESLSEDNFGKVRLENINLIGNASRDSKIDADGALASAGGIICLKVERSVSILCENIIGNSFFITYFPEEGAILNANNVKCYDSYQNAVFVWGNTKVNFTDSFLNGAGGPVVICTSPKDNNDIYTIPMFTATNTVIETHLSGEEIWFTAVNATPIVAQIKALNQALQLAQLGSFVDGKGMMNIEGLIMGEGSDAAVIITAIDAQGQLIINGSGMDRVLSETNLNWTQIKGVTEYVAGLTGQLPPFFTVTDAEGNAHTVWFNGETLVDLQQRPLGTDASHAAIAAAFAQANKVTLTQGGLSVVFELYH